MALNPSNRGAIVLRLRGDVSQLQGELKKVAADLKKMKDTAGNTGKGIGNSIGKANQVVFSFAAGLEDAAFGIRGVANNIPFLIQSVSHLTSSVGSGTSALKAIGSSLLGLPGIMVAVSAASFVAMGGLDQLRGMFDRAGRSVDAYADKIRSAADAAFKFESIDGLTVQARQLPRLLGIARGELSATERAIQELQETTFGGRTAQQIRIAGASGVRLSQEEHDFVRNQQIQLQLLEEQRVRREPIVDTFSEQVEMANEIARIQGSYNQQLDETVKLTERQQRALREIRVAEEDVKGQDVSLEGGLNLGDLLKIDKNDVESKMNALRALFTQGLVEPMSFFSQQAALAQRELMSLAEAGRVNSEEFERYADVLRESNIQLEQMRESAKATNAELRALKSVGMTVFQSLSQAIVDMVFEMKSAQDVARSLFKTILSAGLSFGLRALFGSLTGGASEAAGAAGGLGFIPLPRMFATGGIVSKPTLGVVGEAGPEAVIPLSRLSSIMGQGRLVGEFVLRGEDLALSVEAGQRSLNRKYGG